MRRRQPDALRDGHVCIQHELQCQQDYDDTVTDSFSGTTTSEYDVNGNLIQVSSPQGTINYTYDPATGNKIEISTSNTSIQYSYDQAGEIKSATVRKLEKTLASPRHKLQLRPGRKSRQHSERQRHNRDSQPATTSIS